jgi:hypothetical protein
MEVASNHAAALLAGGSELKLTEPVDLSGLDRTQEETKLRTLIREHARTQEGYDARLYDLWEKWNEEFFEGRLVPSLILLAEPGQTHSYGDCSNFSGLAGIRSRIRLRPSILAGTLRDLKRGSRNPQGLRRFLEDVLLHEMIHQWHFEVTGQGDESYSGHGPAFSAKANEIGTRLGLPTVRRTCKSRDGEEPSPSQWPHNVRPAGYYLGAHVPASGDKPEEDRPALCKSAAVSLARRFSVEEIRAITEMAIQAKEEASA